MKFPIEAPPNIKANQLVQASETHADSPASPADSPARRVYPRGMAIAAIATVPLTALPAVAMFQALETQSKTPCDHQLTRVQDIPYQCWQFEDPEAKLPVWKYSLGFEFGKLTRQQWEKIAIAYGSWRTAERITESAFFPAYNPHKDYWLMDFMPPIMQAKNRHRFIRQQSPHAPDQTNTSIIANCWGTLYEILRLRHSPSSEPSFLMMVDAQTILTTLESLSTPTLTPQPGDVLLISHQHPIRDAGSLATPFSSGSSADRPQKVYLDHAALVVDKGLVFEKAGAGDRVPYRLVGLSTIQRIWRRDVFDYEIRRLMANSTLPHPLSFGVDQTANTLIADEDAHNPSQQYYSIVPLPPLVQADGRARLSPLVYESDYYQSRVSHSPEVNSLNKSLKDSDRSQ